MSNKGSPCHRKEMMEATQQGHIHSIDMVQQYSRLFEAFVQSVKTFESISHKFILPQQIHKQQNQQLLSLTRHVIVVQSLYNGMTQLCYQMP